MKGTAGSKFHPRAKEVATERRQLAMQSTDNRWANTHRRIGMKMKLITALCTATVAVVALPAFADHTIAGYARTNFVSELFGEGQNTAINQAKDAHADNVVDERIRARWQNNINEYVNVVL